MTTRCVLKSDKSAHVESDKIQERLTAKEAMAHPYFNPVRQACMQNNNATSS